MTNNELKQLYANNLISIKEFIKALNLLENKNPIAVEFIEALKLKTKNKGELK